MHALTQSHYVTLAAARKSIRLVLTRSKVLRKKRRAVKMAIGRDDGNDRLIQNSDLLVKSCLRVLRDLSYLEEKELRFDEEKVKSMSLALAQAYEDLISELVA